LNPVPRPPQSGGKPPHSKGSDPLRDEQYRDATNLKTRIALHERFSDQSTPWARWVFERLPKRADATVLEVGCGSARLWAENIDRLPQDWNVHLSDFSRGMLADARRALPERSFRYVVADAQALPFDDGRFDFVIANHMLYHVPDRPRALRDIARVLAADGCLVASTVGDRHLVEIDDLLVECGAPTGMGAAIVAEFTLQNGGTQLATVFAEVAMQRYPSTLRVTEVEPLVAYVRSVPGAEALSAAMLERIRMTVARQITARGAFEIGTDTGVFVARRRDGAGPH
jgi:ubiquinone/menaquinone biosynthesis C-methylase UbiE